MTFTKQHVAENAELYRVAKDALVYVGWKPDPEPRNWPGLARLAVVKVADTFPNVTYSRMRHQVMRVVMYYRGKPGEWGVVRDE